jgi:SAM-dependent methyltransferase
MMSSIFDKTLAGGFIDLCSTCIDFDSAKAVELTTNAIRYYRGDKDARSSMRELQAIESRWYKSLAKGKPDYSVYSDPYFLCEVWACWMVYSRKYLLEIQSSKSLGTKSIVTDIGKVKTVADLGCGFGYTTAALKEIFPKADVVGTNVKPSSQYTVASRIGKEREFIMRPSALGIHFDLVVAFEYFEHILNPIEHLNEIVESCKPKFFLIANSFNTTSVGHFDEYLHCGARIAGKDISRMFNQEMREHGYEMVKTKLWNNKPAYWKRSISR